MRSSGSASWSRRAPRGPGTRLPGKSIWPGARALAEFPAEAVRPSRRRGSSRSGRATDVRQQFDPGQLSSRRSPRPTFSREGPCSSCSRYGAYFEPEAAALAAQRGDTEVSSAASSQLDRMIAAGDSADDLVEADAAFHDVIARAPGNGVLRALLRSLSTSTVRARLWHGIADRGALDQAREEHAGIYEAIAAGHADLARHRRCCTSRPTRTGCESISTPPRTSLSTAADRSSSGDWPWGQPPSAGCTRRSGRDGGAMWSIQPGARDPLLRYGAALRRRACRASAWWRSERPAEGRVRRVDQGRPPPSTGRSTWGGAPGLVDYFDFSHDATLRSLEESLGRLGLDRVDIAFVHDPDDHFDEALAGSFRALRRLRDERVVRAIGIGANQPAVLCRFAREADPDCFLVAGRFTALDRTAEAELLPLCEAGGIAVIAGGVFNSGVIAGGTTFDYEIRSPRGRRARGAAPRDLRAPRRPARRCGAPVSVTAPSRCHRPRRLPHPR